MGLVMLLPLLAVLGGLSGGGEHWDTIAGTVLGSYVVNTVLLSAGVVALSTAIGTLAAWIQTFYDYPLRRWFDVLLLLPLAIPGYVAAFIYSGIFSYGGMFQRFFREVLGMTPGTYPRVQIESMVGLILVLSVGLYPYVYVTVRAALSRQSMGPIEAARSLSAGEAGVFVRVGLPLLRPALAAGASIVLMEALNEYGAAVYYGVPTMSVGVFRTWFAYNDLQSTRFLASLFLVAVFLILGLERRLRGPARRDVTGSYAGVHRRRPSQRGRLAVYALVGTPVLLGFAVPTLKLVHWALLSTRSVDWSLVGRSAGNTVLAGAAGTAVCMAVGLVLAYAPRVAGGYALRWWSSLAALGHAIPGSIIAVGVLTLLAGNRVLAIGSFAALTFAYTVRYLALAHRPVAEAFDAFSGVFVEAGRTLGKGPTRTLFSVNLPIMGPTLRAAALVAMIDIVQDLPLTTVLRPFDFPTLAVETFRLAGDERLAESSIMALLLVAVGVLPILIHGVSRRRLRRNPV
jgi:iron(III) transport system permease protein